MTLERVFILVFDMDTEREAIYTTSSRTPTRATNAFVVFETLLDAVRAAMALSEVTREMPVVDEVPPAVVSLLRESAAYDVEFVRENGEFRVPEVIIDEGATVVRDADGERAVEARALAMSAEDLAAYVSTSKARVVVEDEDEDDDEARIEAARTNAARVMRDALRAPVIAVRDAAKSASDAPVRGAKIYVSAAKSAMRAMVDVARRRARDGE